jgi:dipeptidase
MPKSQYKKRCELCVLGKIDFESTNYWCSKKLKSGSKECKKRYKIQPFII